MSDSEDKKESWLEKLSSEPVSEEAFQDTWTRTVFVSGKPKGQRQPTEQPAEAESNQPIEQVPQPALDIKADMIVGQVIADKYMVNGLIGKGGMSSIYSVRHMQLDTVLALKLLDKTMWSDPTAVKRFQLEAQTVSKLTHPNLITYRDYGVTPDGQPYLVMDYIKGRTLGQKIKETHGLFLPMALEVFVQLCEGLSVAHSLGIVHRDVKPGNIMFISEDSDRIKLVDFGIAKIVAESANEQQNLTKTGDVFGSPLYMSPEQCMGKRLDNRSDIYALGCVIYEAMTGKHAISGNTILDTMNRHVSAMPSPPSEIRPDLYAAEKASWLNVDEFEYVVMKCLQKNPADRYKSVDDLLLDLKKIKGQTEVTRDAPVASVKKLRGNSEIDRTSPKEMIQMAATVAYMMVALAVAGAAVYFFFLMPKPAAQVADSAPVEKKPTGPNTNLLLDGSMELEDVNSFRTRAAQYMEKGKYTEAAGVIEAAITMLKEKGRKDFILAELYKMLGKCYRETKNYKRAIECYKDAMGIYQERTAQNPDLGIPMRKECMLLQAEILKDLNQHDEAKKMEDEANDLGLKPEDM